MRTIAEGSTIAPEVAQAINDDAGGAAELQLRQQRPPLQRLRRFHHRELREEATLAADHGARRRKVLRKRCCNIPCRGTLAIWVSALLATSLPSRFACCGHNRFNLSIRIARNEVTWPRARRSGDGGTGHNCWRDGQLVNRCATCCARAHLKQPYNLIIDGELPTSTHTCPLFMYV